MQRQPHGLCNIFHGSTGSFNSTATGRQMGDWSHHGFIDCELSKLIYLHHLGLRLTERRHSSSLSQLLCQPSHQQPEFAGLSPAKVCIETVTIPGLSSQDMEMLVHLSCLLDRIHQILPPPSPPPCLKYHCRLTVIPYHVCAFQDVNS